MTEPFIPRRAVHLDFHTGPDIPDVAADFDPATFAEPFIEARVDSVTLFAKCHHGHLYYDTDRPERHPSLPTGLDLLGEQIEALRSAGIRTPIYISAQCDEYAANQHPEWIAMNPDLSQVKWGQSAFEAGWQILDMSSPYQDYLADQISDVLRRFAPVDGIFLDMCWDQPSVSRWALQGMRRAGFEPTDAADRARYARQVAYGYMRRFRDLIRAAQEGSRPASIFFNSRDRTNLQDERDLVTHSEVESLPTGGWGYSYTPFIGRYVRALGIPVFGMTGRFHLSWGDNSALKPAAALKYECCQLLTMGLGASVGDLLHPRCVPHPATYGLIGGVYRHLQACERHLDGTAPQTEVALVIGPDAAGSGRTAVSGAIRMLQQLRQQFDVVGTAVDMSGYRLAVVPDGVVLDSAAARGLQECIDGGGSVFSCADSEEFLAGFDIAVEGELPYTHTFLRPGPELREVTADYDTVVYERGRVLRSGSGATVLAGIVEPYFERTYAHFSGHSYTAPDRLGTHPALVQQGSVIACALPLFRTFGSYGNVPYREIVGGCLDRLLPDPLVRAGGPAHLETGVVAGPGRTVVHLLSYLPARAGEIDLVTDPFPLLDVPVQVRLGSAPRQVRLEPHGIDVPFEYAEGYVRCSVTIPDGHGMLVIER